LVVGWRPPSVSCHMSLCNKSQQTEKAIADWASKSKIILLEVTSHYLWLILFVRSMLGRPVHTQMEEVRQEHKYYKGHPWGHLRVDMTQAETWCMVLGLVQGHYHAKCPDIVHLFALDQGWIPPYW
jgi:hypothetical protein